jgi:hypothetical protein
MSGSTGLRRRSLQEYSRRASRSGRGRCAATKRSALASVHMTSSGGFGKQILPPSCSSTWFRLPIFFLPFAGSSCFTQNRHSGIWIMLLRAVKLFIILYICMIQCNISRKQDETTPFFCTELRVTCLQIPPLQCMKNNPKNSMDNSTFKHN